MQTSILTDFIYLDKCNKKSERLQKLYDALSTSTLSERAFSICGFIKTKEKNRYSPKHLNCVLFLRDYFKLNS